jgi:hypothetical protein
MTTKPDDLEAVRTIADTLEPFENPDRDRILRWVRERLGMQQAAAALLKITSNRRLRATAFR